MSQTNVKTLPRQKKLKFSKVDKIFEFANLGRRPGLEIELPEIGIRIAPHRCQAGSPRLSRAASKIDKRALKTTARTIRRALKANKLAKKDLKIVYKTILGEVKQKVGEWKEQADEVKEVLGCLIPKLRQTRG